MKLNKGYIHILIAFIVGFIALLFDSSIDAAQIFRDILLINIVISIYDIK